MSFSSAFSWRSFALNMGLLLAGVFLFALPHPTDLFLPGLPLLAYIAYVPVFILVERAGFKTVWVYGFFYGVLSYAVFVSWLGTFNPAAMPVISIMYGLYLMVAFPLMKLLSRLFPRARFYAQWLVFCAYEYIKTLGFQGFHYGVTAYSQWQVPLVIQAAAVCGVFGLSAVITFFSAWTTTFLMDSGCTVLEKLRRNWIPLAAWCGLLACILLYGVISPVDYSSTDTVPVVLVQPNSDPWVGGFSSYARDLKTLTSLTDEALLEHPDTKIVVWPETAFVPRITWHYQYREDRDRFELVQKLLEYIDSKDVTFVIGNDDGVMDYNREGVYTQVDYNSVLLFEPGKNVLPPKPVVYHKVHLVPFTEWFPYKKQLPVVYKMLEENDTHFWDPGSEYTVFSVAGLSFATPICFEDTFGSMGRNFVNSGARAFLNLTNDAWAHSRACQKQHLAMALFRSVENRVPTVRSTASGETAFIDPNGRVKALAEPFAETYLYANVPVVKDYKPTLYTRFGDWAGKLNTLLVLFLFVGGGASHLARRVRNV